MKFLTIFLCTSTGNKSNIVDKVVLPSAGGVIVIVIFGIVILLVRRLRRQNRPNPEVDEEHRPILDADEEVNRFSSTSEISELTLGRASSMPSSKGSSSCSDITVPNKDPFDSKNKSYEEVLC